MHPIGPAGTRLELKVKTGSLASSRTLRVLRRSEGKGLVYMGKVGTGWNRTTSSKIRRALDEVVSPKSKLSKPLRKPKAASVESVFAAEVEYRDITSEGLLRASSFKGVRHN
ncbi:hypothetical protein [Bradyrhizobium pachyrhizi]|uniref:ATP dependent DNA ligase n=1 Tax=Bradyrhizobium pachyrhizi TaxID=280333 RepID=UPI003D366D76